MQLERMFRSAVAELVNRQIPFAVAGGLAASLYRKETRVTMDVDLCVDIKKQSRKIAIAVIESLNLSASIVREADLAGGPLFAIRKGTTRPCIVVGHSSEGGADGGVDLLLPSLPWVSDAVARAQSCLIDFGFGMIPVLTLEDVILSKLYALTSALPRPRDMDDLQAIFQAEHNVDMAYLAGQTRHFGIRVSKTALPFLPDPIRKLASRGRHSKT